MYLFWTVLFAFLFSGCSGLAPRQDEDNLSADYAISRSQQVKKVDYHLSFFFHRNQTHFDARAIINVELNNTKMPLTIDMLYKELKTLKIDGVEINHFEKNTGFITVGPEFLKEKFSIDIEYSQVFDQNSKGLVYFLDSEDKREYIFSNSEPYDAHRFFPCFDQPNLKSTFQVSIKAPQTWTVINNAPIEKTHIDGEYKETTFQKTMPFSSYLLFVGAGDFVKIEDRFATIPLNIYVRKSLQKYLDPTDIFAVTKQGLAFFQKYFQYNYPFKKYDHIFAPTLSAGAMENPGAVTMNEHMIFRGPVDKTTRASRSNTILHEMVHMWFGDLVTMKWWNDLWLNESFATYMAFIALDRALGTKETWNDFLDLKNWAYYQDQLVTTHPIESNALTDTRMAVSNFDGITYAKGASALKQLHFYVGEEAFKTGIQNYFAKYAWKNTQRKDFTDSISRAAGIDLEKWIAAWLQSSGLHQVGPEWSCREERIDSFAILQTPNKSGIFSPHRGTVSFYNHEGTEYKTFVASFEDERTILKEAIGIECPAFVFTNTNDYDYALHYLDEVSQQFVFENFERLKDPFLNQLIWNSLFQMVYNQKLSAKRFMHFALAHLAKVRNIGLLSSLTGGQGPLSQVFWSYLTKQQRDDISTQLEEVVWKQVLKYPPHSDKFLLWLDFYLSIARSNKAINTLTLLLANNHHLIKFELDHQRRWKILHRLGNTANFSIDPLLTQEQKKDPSDFGKINALKVEMAKVSPASKERAFQMIVEKRNVTWDHLKKSMGSFFSPDYPELSRPYVKDIFNMAIELDQHPSDHGRALSYLRMLPSYIDENFLQLSIQKYQEVESKLKSTTRRAWIELNDRVERNQKIRSFNR